MVEYINGKKVVEGYTEGARVYNNANITISNSSLTDLTYNTERYDTDNIHDTGSNTDRLTCQTKGKYEISGNIRWAVNTSGVRYLIIFLNNTTNIGYKALGAYNDVMFMNVTTIYDLSVGDYVTLRVLQNRGGDLDIQSQSAYSPEFMMQRVG